jgi:nitroreductase
MNRYSVRAYQPRPVPAEALQRILDAARRAPSARNVQEWRFIVVTDDATREALVPAAAMQKFVGQAPVVIAGCGTNTDYVMRCGQPAYVIDLAIAMEHIALQAVREGLGTCWIGAFHEPDVKRVLKVPDNVRVVQLMTLGYPADKPRPHDRVPLDKIVFRDRWGRVGE